MVMMMRQMVTMKVNFEVYIKSEMNFSFSDPFRFLPSTNARKNHNKDDDDD